MIAASRTWLAGPPIHRAGSGVHALLDSAAHVTTSKLNDRKHLLVGEISERSPGADAGGKAGLGLPNIADPSEVA
ncbi:MAG: hypothetical protein ACRENC_19495, partial [Gemmatimonadaceae bacterium]